MREEPGLRHNEGKTKWGYLDYPSLEGIVKVLTKAHESGKYPKYNWKRGMTTVEVCESLLRHTFAYLSGEDIDPESGLRHIDHIGSNQHILSYTDLFKTEFDNRECKEFDKLNIKSVSKDFVKGSVKVTEEINDHFDDSIFNDPDFIEELRKEFFKDLEEAASKFMENTTEEPTEPKGVLEVSKAFITNIDSVLKDPDIGYMWSNVNSRQESENINELKCTKSIEDVNPGVPFLRHVGEPIGTIIKYEEAGDIIVTYKPNDGQICWGYCGCQGECENEYKNVSDYED